MEILQVRTVTEGAETTDHNDSAHSVRVVRLQQGGVMRWFSQWLFSVAGACAFAGMSLASSFSHAQSGADFYKGKTVTYVVAGGPGGGYDVYGRLVAEYMQKHLPDSTFVVKNMPGAGHLIGANLIYASKPHGLTIGIFNTGLIYSQLIKKEGVKFDLAQMSWIGKAASEPRARVIAAQSPIKKNGYGHFLVQIGGDNRDVPQLSSVVTDPASKAVIALIQSQGDIGRLTAGPPGIPQDRLNTLRAAYRSALEDKEQSPRPRGFAFP